MDCLLDVNAARGPGRLKCPCGVPVAEHRTQKKMHKRRGFLVAKPVFVDVPHTAWEKPQRNKFLEEHNILQQQEACSQAVTGLAPIQCHDEVSSVMSATFVLIVSVPSLITAP